MGKKEKVAFDAKLKKVVKRTREETDEEYLRRVMGEKAVKKPLKPVDHIHLKDDNNKIITHDDSERY